MEKTTRPIQPARAFWTVIVVTVGWAAITSILAASWDILWTDVLRDNPHRTMSHALTELPLVYLVAGLVMLLYFYFAALVAAAAIAATLAAYFGRVPFWPFLGTLPIYAALIFAQDKAIKPFHWYTDLPEEIAQY